MKLTEIAIDGYQGTSQTYMKGLGHGLNVIFGTHPVSRQAITSFIRDILYGPDLNAMPTRFWPNGYLHVQSGGQSYRLERPASELTAGHTGHPSQLAISDLDGNHTGFRTPEVLNQIDHAAYGTFFSVPLESANWNWTGFIEQLVRQFDLNPTSVTGHSMPFAADAASFQTWKRAAEARIPRYESIQREIQNLTDQRNRLLAERDQLAGRHRSRLSAIESELAEVQSRIDSLSESIRSERHRLADLDRQIAELHQFIESESSRIQHIPVARTDDNMLALFYERLDEVDNQIRRWRSVQSDIQDQRLRLRDEMVANGELSIESNEHPYHDAREITQSLEIKIGRTEDIARNWEQNFSPGENERRLTSLCNEMRGDLQALCTELGRQYKHVRHKAAVAELKQLRRCYHEMDENVKRLLVRRESVIEEIRRLDPAGAEAILMGDQQFILVAEQEGFLAARRRFVAGTPVPQPVATEYRTVYPDVSTEQARLAELQSSRSLTAGRLATLERENQPLDSRRGSLLDEKNRFLESHDAALEARLGELNSRLALLENERASLSAQVETDRPWLNWQPNYLLAEANRFLNQVSDRTLTEILIDGSHSVQVRTDHGVTSSALQLSPTQQGMVRLALSLAAIEQLSLRGIRLPVLIEDADVAMNAQSLLSALASFCQNGHQVLLLTPTAALVHQSRQYEATIFELPDTNITMPTWQPEMPSLPRHDFTTPPVSRSTWHTYDPGREPGSLTIPYDQNQASNFQAINYQSSPAPYPESRKPVVPMNPFNRPETRTTGQSSTPTFIPTPVVEAPRTAIGRDTLLQEIDLVESIYLTPMEGLGIRTVGQLLDLEMNDLDSDLVRRGFNADQIDRWQAQAWLQICLPDLAATDARVLIGSGIDQPEQLLQMDASEIQDRIRRYLDSTAGRRSNANMSQFNNRRLQSWSSSLRTDNGWRTYTRSRYRNRPAQGNRNRSSHDSTTHVSRSDRPSRKSPTIDRQRTARLSTSDQRNGKHSSASKPIIRSTETSSTRYQYYLKHSDDIEAAPSIGPKAAERFYDIGVNTVHDFLQADAGDMAARLNNRRMSEKTLKIWQQQSRLMCAVPNLRGHDVQILIACDITEPEELARQDPNQLLGVVSSFVDTKEGARVLRNGKRPDLDEMNDWIDSAKHIGSSQAA